MRNLKKVLSLALALVMLLGMMVVGAGAATSFKDDDDIKNQEAVAVLVGMGIMKGREDGSNFEPAGTLTRAEAAMMIAQMDLGVDAAAALVANGTNTFSDVWSGYWAGGAIDYCVEQGYITGDGNGHFFPGRNVSSVEFGIMLLRLLGYDAKIEGLVGNEWAAKGAALARKAGLTAGVVANTQPMTRDDMAQMSFNALTAALVEYEGMDITIGDVAINARSKIRTHTGSSSLGVSNTTYNGDPIQANITPIRLCEEKFPTLKLNDTGAVDAFGRTYSVWKWKNVDIAGSRVLVNANAEFTASTNAAGVRAQIGSAKGGSVIVDGKDETPASTTTVNAAYIAGLTQNGRQVQVYLDNKDNTVIDKVVVINTYVGRVSSVNSAKETINVAALTSPVDDDGNSKGSVNGNGVEATDFANRDVVLYKAAWNSSTKRYDVKTVDHLGQPTTGVLTKWQGTSISTDTEAGKAESNFTVDSGDPYKYSINAYVVDDADAPYDVWRFTVNKSEIDVYTDQYGYAIYIAGVEGTKNYAAVIGTGNTNPYGDETTGVTLLLADSTRKSVTATLSKNTSKFTDRTGAQDVEANGAQLVTDLVGDLVTYVENDDGTYTLNMEDNWDKTDVANAKFVNGRSLINLGGVNRYTTSRTLFFVATGAGANIRYNVYTGYSAMPSFKDTGITGFAYKLNSRNNNQIDAVYIAAGELDDVIAADTYFVKSKNADIYTDNTGSYYILPAVVDGEVTTIKLDATREIAGIDWSKNDHASTIGLFAIRNVRKNSNDIITNFDDARVNAFGAAGAGRNGQVGVVAADGVVLGINPSTTARANTNALRNAATYWAYTNDTHAFTVADDYSSITAVDITNINTDLNDLVYASVRTVNSNAISLTNVFVVDQDDNTTPTPPDVTAPEGAKAAIKTGDTGSALAIGYLGDFEINEANLTAVVKDWATTLGGFKAIGPMTPTTTAGTYQWACYYDEGATVLGKVVTLNALADVNPGIRVHYVVTSGADAANGWEIVSNTTANNDTQFNRAASTLWVKSSNSTGHYARAKAPNATAWTWSEAVGGNNTTFTDSDNSRQFVVINDHDYEVCQDAAVKRIAINTATNYYYAETDVGTQVLSTFKKGTDLSAYANAAGTGAREAAVSSYVAYASIDADDGDTWFDGMVSIASAANAVTAVGTNTTNLDCVPANTTNLEVTLTNGTEVIDGAGHIYTPDGTTHKITIANTGTSNIVLSKALAVVLTPLATNANGVTLVYKDANGNTLSGTVKVAANAKITAEATFGAPGFTTAATSNTTIAFASDAAANATVAAKAGADYGAWAAGSGNVSQTLTFSNSTAIGKAPNASVRVVAEFTILQAATLTPTFTIGSAT